VTTSLNSGTSGATALGVIAILLWSTTIGCLRILTAALGTFTTAAIVYTLAGALGCLALALRRGALRRVLALPKAYLFGCGALCVMCIAGLNTAVGFSASKAQVLEVSVVNYLWPALTLFLSVPILGRKARPWLALGVILSLGGVFLALQQGTRTTWAGFAERFAARPAPYLFVLMAALAWAFYSTLSRRVGGDSGAMPLFLLAAGLLLGLVRLTVTETAAWSWKVVPALVYTAVCPSLLAYTFWDIAMRKGRIVLLAAFSYLIPILSVGFTCLLLSIRPAWTLWAACVLVVAGAVISKLSISDPSPPVPSAPDDS